MVVSDGESSQSAVAHEQYLAEAELLIGEQVTALYNSLETAIRTAAGASGADVAVTRDDRSFTATAGGRTLACGVEAVTDLPEDTDRAHVFPEGQARCTVQAPDGTSAVWVLQRFGAGPNVRYGWAHADTHAPITNDDLAALAHAVISD